METIGFLRYKCNYNLGRYELIDFCMTVSQNIKLILRFICLFLQLDATNKRIAHIDEGLHVFIKVQLGLFSAMIVLFAVVMYYATYFM